MRDLTEAQIAVLKAMPRPEKSKWLGFGADKLSYAARDACVRKGLIESRQCGRIDEYVLTEAGRLALAEQEARDA